MDAAYLITSLQGQGFVCKDPGQQQQLKGGGMFGYPFMDSASHNGDMAKSFPQGRVRWLQLG